MTDSWLKETDGFFEIRQLYNPLILYGLRPKTDG